MFEVCVSYRVTGTCEARYVNNMNQIRQHYAGRKTSRKSGLTTSLHSSL